MEIIKVGVDWSNKNFSCYWQDPMGGIVSCTEKDLQTLKYNFKESLELHIDGCLSGGDEVPSWLQDRLYTIEWYLEIAAILRECEHYTTLSAISHACGINQRQLSHYANGLKKARQEQRDKIIKGIQAIGSHLLNIGQ